jgi:hypothetical protein
MALFATVMSVDIDAFGRRMKKKATELYKAIGLFVLLAIGSLIVAGWMLVGSTPTVAVLAVSAHVTAILICHFMLPKIAETSVDAPLDWQVTESTRLQVPADAAR